MEHDHFKIGVVTYGVEFFNVRFFLSLEQFSDRCAEGLLPVVSVPSFFPYFIVSLLRQLLLEHAWYLQFVQCTFLLVR